MTDVWKKAADFIAAGVPNVWIIDPFTLASELRTANGIEQIRERTLRIPGTKDRDPVARRHGRIGIA